MLGEGNLWNISASKGDQLDSEVYGIEGRGAYHRIQVKDETGLALPA